MKKIKLFTLSAIVASLAFGIATALTSKKTQTTEASWIKPNSGIFYKVDNMDKLAKNVNVIIATEDGYVLDDVWGNPGYVHGTKDGVRMSTDGDLITLENSPATIFAVEEGTEENSYAFRAPDMSLTGQKCKNVYLGHNEKEGYGESNFDNIGWFKDRDIAIQKTKKLESSFFIDFGIEKDNYDNDVRVSYIRNCKNVLGNPNTYLSFTTYYAPRFVSDAGTRVYLFREYKESEYSINVTQQPDKTNYEQGEAISLDGLEINIHSPIHDYVDVVYNDHRADFSFPETAYGTGDVLITCRYIGFVFTLTINVTKTYDVVNKIGPLADYRGKYMLISENMERGVNPSNGDWMSFMKEEPHGSGKWRPKLSSEFDDLIFELTKDNSGYHLKYGTDSYLDVNTFTLTNSSIPVVVIEQISDGITFKSSSGNYVFFDVYDTYEFKVGDYTDGDSVILCKCPLSDTEEANLNTFGNKLLDDTDVCDPAGSVFTIGSTVWSGLQTSYEGLSGAAQASLVNITYNVDNISLRSMEHAISRYDYIYQKYHATEDYSYINDFMGRAAAGTMHEYLSSPNITVVNPINNNSSTVIIVIVAVTSITSIGVLLVIKRKRTLN